MRQPKGIPLTIAISAFVHLALFGAARTWVPTPAPPAPHAPVTIELTAPVADVAPTDVTFLDEAAVSALETNGDRPLSPETREIPEERTKGDRPLSPGTTEIRTTQDKGDRPLSPHIAATRGATLETARGTDGATTDGATTDGTPTDGGHTGALSMRRGTRPDLSLPAGRWDEFEHAPAGTVPEQDLSTGKLQPDGGGTRRSDQGAFTAKVARDGSVNLKDKRNFNIHLTLPRAKDLGDMFQAWYYDKDKPVGTLGSERTRRQKKVARGRGDVTGAERLGGDDEAIYGSDRAPQPGDGGGIPIAAGGFDLTDAFMRSKGIDPYAAKKLAFLDSTRDERVQMGMRYKREQLAQVAQIVKKNLARVWGGAKTDVDRKRALFELWDECVESGGTEEVEAATQARKLIVGFIRANFPAGSAVAYTAAELAALNRARQSASTFSPYAD